MIFVSPPSPLPPPPFPPASSPTFIAYAVPLDSYPRVLADQGVAHELGDQLVGGAVGVGGGPVHHVDVPVLVLVLRRHVAFVFVVFGVPASAGLPPSLRYGLLAVIVGAGGAPASLRLGRHGRLKGGGGCLEGIACEVIPTS